MATVPESFAAMPRWWSDEPGRQWLSQLPELAARLCAAWGLEEDGRALHGSNALVLPVRRAGKRLALRLAPPGDDVDAEVEALKFWAGHGVVRLVDADVSSRALLLDRLDGGRTLGSLPLREAIEIIADLVVRLAIVAPPTVAGTDQVAGGERAKFARAQMSSTASALGPHLDAAEEFASLLSSRVPGSTAVNGDLHFEQVLRGENGWTVVDPVLLRGDPEYDLGRVLWSRSDEIRDDADLWSLFDLFVSRAGVPRERARMWVVVRSMSYLLWGLEHGLTEDPPRCRRLLDDFAPAGQLARSGVRWWSVSENGGSHPSGSGGSVMRS